MLSRFTKGPAWCVRADLGLSAGETELQYGHPGSTNERFLPMWDIERLLLVGQTPGTNIQRRPFNLHHGFDCRSQQAFFEYMFEESDAVREPRGGVPLTVWRHKALGDWFRCSLAFYDAIELLVPRNSCKER